METELYETASQPVDDTSITIPIEKGLHGKLEALAEKRGLTSENLIHSLIKAELDKEE